MPISRDKCHTCHYWLYKTCCLFLTNHKLLNNVAIYATVFCLIVKSWVKNRITDKKVDFSIWDGLRHTSEQSREELIIPENAPDKKRNSRLGNMVR